MHDVGKSKIDHALINKSGKLSDEEFEQMKFHATASGEILTGMKCYTHNVVMRNSRVAVTPVVLKARRSIVMLASAK